MYVSRQGYEGVRSRITLLLPELRKTHQVAPDSSDAGVLLLIKPECDRMIPPDVDPEN